MKNAFGHDFEPDPLDVARDASVDAMSTDSITFLKPNITAAQFKKLTGHPPEQDDLERCNCDAAGKNLGHCHCGICAEHLMPVFMCKVCFLISCQEPNSLKRVVIINV